MMRSLPACCTVEIVEKPLIRGGLDPASSRGVLQIRSHGVRYFLEAFRYQMGIS
jgi:hypothetical protein